MYSYDFRKICKKRIDEGVRWVDNRDSGIHGGYHCHDVLRGVSNDGTRVPGPHDRAGAVGEGSSRADQRSNQRKEVAGETNDGAKGTAPRIPTGNKREEEVNN